jgi:hypothetical protein
VAPLPRTEAITRTNCRTSLVSSVMRISI